MAKPTASSSSTESLSAERALEILASLTGHVDLDSLVYKEGRFRIRDRKAEDEQAAKGIGVYQKVAIATGRLTVSTGLRAILIPVEDDGSTSNQTVELACLFEVVYRLAADHSFSSGDLEAFGRVGSIFHVWPYWRQFVQESLTRLEMPILTLPLLQPGAAAILAGYGRPQPNKVNG